MFRITWVNTRAADFVDRGADKRRALIVLDVEPAGSLLAVDRKFLRVWVTCVKKMKNNTVEFSFECMGNEPELTVERRSLTVKNDSFLTEELWQ